MIAGYYHRIYGRETNCSVIGVDLIRSPWIMSDDDFGLELSDKKGDFIAKTGIMLQSSIDVS